MFLKDRVSVTAPRRTADGYLVAEAFVARTGIQDYLGSELGRPDLEVVRLYRPPEEVFSDETLRSYAHRPMTNDHPPEQVNADNWKKYAVGQTGDEVAHDQTRVRVPLVLMDQQAITDYEAGKRELSQGYSAEIDWTAGTTPEGEHYDAVQRHIRNNHLALVRRGRAGSQFRIGDGRAPGDPDYSAVNPTRNHTMSDTKTRTVMVDGLPVECTDASAIAIDKLQRQLSDSNAVAARQATEHTEALAVKDAEIAKRDAAIDDLKSKVLDAAALDARVQARGDLLATAKSIHDADYRGKSDADVRKAAVIGKLGDAAIAGKGDAYIEARFDILADGVKATDPVTRALSDGATRISANDAQSLEDKAYQRSLDRFNRKKEA
ncbi:DUF2213 domain-containing protein [Xanthomonas prunicola]|uniref:DUF2213 domain-containing protein n=1 Tax=Xanthomonas prunicola TaxID=2053930 RepID=A0A9Q9J0E3_9XANT|nr:DUF2213 domain-containing protein [Xanthomonas prunicola]UXA66019.1 DUF2213 domain-containing protein [Xanthomonas prunicola]